MYKIKNYLDLLFLMICIQYNNYLICFLYRVFWSQASLNGSTNACFFYLFVLFICLLSACCHMEYYEGGANKWVNMYVRPLLTFRIELNSHTRRNELLILRNWVLNNWLIFIVHLPGSTVCYAGYCIVMQSALETFDLIYLLFVYFCTAPLLEV